MEKEAHLLELCRYVVLNPVRIKGGASAQGWKWSSYRATAGLSSVPEFLSTDWILSQFELLQPLRSVQNVLQANSKAWDVIEADNRSRARLFY